MADWLWGLLHKTSLFDRYPEKYKLPTETTHHFTILFSAFDFKLSCWQGGDRMTGVWQGQYITSQPLILEIAFIIRFFFTLIYLLISTLEGHVCIMYVYKLRYTTSIAGLTKQNNYITSSIIRPHTPYHPLYCGLSPYKYEIHNIYVTVGVGYLYSIGYMGSWSEAYEYSTLEAWLARELCTPFALTMLLYIYLHIWATQTPINAGADLHGQCFEFISEEETSISRTYKHSHPYFIVFIVPYIIYYVIYCFVLKVQCFWQYLREKSVSNTYFLSDSCGLDVYVFLFYILLLKLLVIHKWITMLRMRV